MTAISQTLEKKPLLAESESKASFQCLSIHVFHCGQGDTILLEIRQRKWILIDCNLTKGPSLDAFKKFLEDKNVRRLDFVCLSHPHDDHYTGLEDILRHFTSEGRTVGYFCDAGTEPKEVSVLLKRHKQPKGSVQAFESLYKFVYESIENGSIQYYRADKHTEPLPIGDGEGFRLLPIGPSPEVCKLALQKVGSGGELKEDLNRLSLILAVLVQVGDRSFSGLLSGDTDALGFASAMKSIKERLRLSHDPQFDFVKVSHHGSMHSHRDSNVCSYKTTETGPIAAVSAGYGRVLPDREVLRDFIQNAWTVLMTTKRLNKLPTYGIQLAARGPINVRTFNLCVNWHQDTGISWSPSEAKIELSELEFYESANDAAASSSLVRVAPSP